MKRILLIAEAATLAHVGRPTVLARHLSRMGHDVILARPQAFDWLTQDEPFSSVGLDCQSPAEFARRLEAGKPLYDLETLQAYVDADLALLQQHKPDMVIGDFRLSLSVSARLHGLPYATVCDAYWSPEAPLNPALPVLPITRFAPISLAERIFSMVAPLAFRLHARPMEALRRRHGLPGLDHDLRRCYTDADYRLFANPQPLFPEIKEHSGARFIGPIAWSHNSPLPDDFPEGGHIYVSMGSSGSTQALSAIIDALEKDPRPAIITTAGRSIPPLPPGSRIKVYDFLPGSAATQNASLIICNGGSPTTNQALGAGVPILGIPTNMDQFLNMRAIERYRAGLTIRADRLNANRAHAALALLGPQSELHQKARAVAKHLASLPTLTDTLESIADGYLAS